MNRKVLSLAFLLVVCLLVPARAADYQIDPIHTTIIYRIKHLQTSWSYGRFNNVSGRVSYDPAAPEKATFESSINAADIDSGNAQRDTHLKSPDFFNAKLYPTIRFKSTSVKKAADDKIEVTGDLNLHGVTKSVTLPLTVVGTAKGPAGETRIGFEGTIDLKRSEFGMTALQQVVGDDVRLILSIEALRK